MEIDKVKLKVLSYRHGMSLNQLAKKSGITAGALYATINRGRITLEIVIAISKALNLTTDEVIHEIMLGE